MRKKWKIWILAGAAVLAAGCTRGIAADDPHEGQSVQYANGFVSMDGGILLDSTNGLRFKNPETGDESYVCAVAGCTHDDEETCTAARLSCAYYPILYDGKIYAISREEGAVYSCQLDGSNLKKCYDFQKNIKTGGTGVRIDQYFYYLAGYEKTDMDEEGYVFVTEASGALYRTNLTDGATEIIYQFPDSFGIGFHDIWYTGDKIVAGVDLQKNSLEEAGYTPKEYFEGITGPDLDAFLKESDKALEVVDEWIAVDLDGQTATRLDLSVLDETTYPCGAWENALLYNKDNMLYYVDLDTNEERLFQGDRNDSESMQIKMLTNGILVSRRMKNDSGMVYEFYPHLSSEPVLLESENFNNYYMEVLYESESKCYVAWMPPQDASDFSEWIYEVIDKEKLLGMEL